MKKTNSGDRINSKKSQKTNSKRNLKKGKTNYTTRNDECSNKSEGKLEAIHSNDINWWNKSPIYEDATAIQMTRIPGYPFDASLEGMSGYVSDPCVMTITYSPTIGVSENYDSPINRGFTSLYAEIVAHTNSGNLGFTQASLGMLAIAAMDVVTNIAAAKRAYGLKNLYLNSNANFPRVLYRACGFVDYDAVDWESVRARLNTIIMDFNSLMIPKYISLYERYFQLPFNIYADESTMGGSFYVFKPVTYYVYADTENKAVAKNLDAQTLPALLSVIEEQLVALRSTSDLGLIMGAYRRAFPQSETVVIDYVDINYLTIPWFDRNMTWQINNMSLIKKSAFNLDSLSVTEDVVADLLLCKPSIDGTLVALDRSLFTNVTTRWSPDGFNASDMAVRINSFDGTTGPEWVMESTRLILGVFADVERNSINVDTTGTEICHDAYVYFNRLDGSNKISINEVLLTTTLDGKSGISTETQTLYHITKFRNHIPIDIANGSDTDLPNYYDLRDFYVSTTITAYQLAQLNRAALQSAFLVNIPTTWAK